MARGDEPPPAHQEMLLRRGGRSPCPSRDVWAEPLRLEVLWKPEAFPLGGGALPERNVFGGRRREQEPGRENYCSLFSVRQDPSLYTPAGLRRVK